MRDSARAPAPVFVIGAPRSGTSVLTWCLGQHPNLLPLEESGWIGRFSLDVGAAFLRGSARGDRSPLCMLGIGADECFAAMGDCIDGLIARHRRALDERSRRVGERDPRQVHAGLATSRADAEPKARWVDGTPEHSLHVAGLQRLFPGARFIHLVRAADDVVDSILRFRHDDGSPLAAGHAAAWAYWLRTVNACVLAEQALGPSRVLRVRHADLQLEPEASMRRILAFLGEDYAAACIEPLSLRLNSCLGAAPLVGEAGADEQLVEHARRLSAHLQGEPQAPRATPAAAVEFASAFDAQVHLNESLDADCSLAQRVLAARDGELQERTAWAHRLDADLAALRRRHEARMGEADDLRARQRTDIVVARRLLAVASACAMGAASLLLGSGLDAGNDALIAAVAAAVASGGGYAWLRRRGASAALAAVLARGGNARPVS